MKPHTSPATPAPGDFCERCGNELSLDELDWGCSYCGVEDWADDADAFADWDETPL